jgi:hypothetical protein
LLLTPCTISKPRRQHGRRWYCNRRWGNHSAAVDCLLIHWAVLLLKQAARDSANTHSQCTGMSVVVRQTAITHSCQSSIVTRNQRHSYSVAGSCCCKKQSTPKRLTLVSAVLVCRYPCRLAMHSLQQQLSKAGGPQR